MTASLARRCQQATGPDADLDADIAVSLGLAPTDLVRGTGINRNNWSGSRGDYWVPPRFTDSFDAAMTLVPEGWRIHSFVQHQGRTYISIHGEHGKIPSHAATPALALCAAALRARGEP